MSTLSPGAPGLSPTIPARTAVDDGPVDESTRQVRDPAGRGWEWSRTATGAAALAALAALVGATDPFHSAFLDVLLGPTEFWLAVTLALIAAAVALMPLHHLLRLAVAGLVLVPAIAGFLAVRPHLSPREQQFLATGPAGLEATVLSDPAGDRASIRAQQSRSSGLSELGARSYTVACLNTHGTQAKLDGLRWSAPNTLTIHRVDGQAATVTVAADGRPTRTLDPRHILTAPGRFGC